MFNVFTTCGCAPPRAASNILIHVPNKRWEVASSQKQQRRISTTHHSSYKCPQRLVDPMHVLLMLIPFGTSCILPRRQTNASSTKTRSMTLTSIFSCDMCKTLAQNTHTMHRHRHSDRIFFVICDLVRLDLMSRVRDPCVPEPGSGGLARSSSYSRRSAISHLERLESNSCSSGPVRRGGGTRGSFNSSCDSSRISSSVCNRKTIFSYH